MKRHSYDMRPKGRELGPEQEGAFTWMLPYSTLMLMMMILFSSLYSSSSTGSLEYEAGLSYLTARDGREASVREIALAKSLKAFIEDMRMEGLADVSVTAHTIKLKLASPVVFESGSAVLKPDIMPLMVRLLDHLRGMENTIIVEGHTDDVPIAGGRYRSNWELSAARAFSVIHFYIDRQIKPERLVAHGHGPYQPLMPNTTDLRRAINRRIEITILRGA